MNIAPVIATTLLLFLAAATRADGTNFPKRKPGLWELTVAQPTGTRPPRSSRFCLDAATDALLMKYSTGMSAKECSRHDALVQGSRAVVHSTCTTMGHEATTETIITYQGDTAVHMEIHAHYAPPLFGKTDSTVQQDARWLSACEPGMSPGDILLPNGMKMNIRTVLGAAQE